MFEIALEKSLDFTSAEYRSLFERSRATAFQHPLWLDHLYSGLAPARSATPLVVTARRRGDGRLAMVLPLLRRKRYGLRVVEFADLGVSDYAAAVCDDAAFERLAQDTRAHSQIMRLIKPFDLIRITKIPEDTQGLEQLFGRARCDTMSMGAHATALFEPYSAWRAAKIPASHARNLAKKRRQVSRQGALSFERLRDPPAIEDLLRDLQKFRGQRYPGDILGQEGYFEFYRQVTLAGAGTGFVRGYRLSLDGRTLSGVWGLSHRQRFLVLISGFDSSDHARRSPGALTFEDVAADCIAEHDTILDFTSGDENYKDEVFGADASPLRMIRACGSGLGVVADQVATRMVPRYRPKELAAFAPEARAASWAGFSF